MHLGIDAFRVFFLSHLLDGFVGLLWLWFSYTINDNSFGIHSIFCVVLEFPRSCPGGFMWF